MNYLVKNMFVTDHALLRWLERAHGVDVEMFRRKLMDEIAPFARPGIYREIVNGLEYRFDGVKLVTIIDRRDDERAEEYAREKMARFFAPIKAKLSKKPKQPEKQKAAPPEPVPADDLAQYHGSIKFWTEQPDLAPATTVEDLTGRRVGALTVVGKLALVKKRWAVRCNCGIYEARSSKAILNPNNAFDCCFRCRAASEEKIKAAKKLAPPEMWNAIRDEIRAEVAQ